VWTNDRDAAVVFRLDPETGRIESRIGGGDILYGLIVTPDGVWSASQFTRTVLRIDPATNRVVARILTRHGDPIAFAYSPGAVWATTRDGVAIRIDTATNRVMATVRAGGDLGSSDPDTEGGLVWIPDPVTGELAAVDPATNAVVGRVPLAEGYSVAQRGFGDVWVARFHDGDEVARIDPARPTG
jgi:streptogramin lyase